MTEPIKINVLTRWYDEATLRAVCREYVFDDKGRLVVVGPERIFDAGPNLIVEGGR